VPGFAPREAQLAFADGVAHAISDGETLIAEAGTGTGKTFAYLAPILLSGRRAVIATATRALQDQLFEHDLPTVTQALGRPLEVRVLKGRTNYLCREKLNQFQPELGVGGAVDIEAVMRWDRATDTGDLAELPELGERPEILNRLTTDRHGCPGGQCPSYAGCHVYRARQRAREADVVVVNHHLLLADRALQAEGFSLLGDTDVVVLDEAHALPDTARAVWGESLSFKQLGQLLGEADKRLAGRGNAVRALRNALAQGLPLAPGSHGRTGLEAAVTRRLESIAEALVELDAELNLLEDEPTELRRRLLAALAVLQAWMAPDAIVDDSTELAASAVSRSIEVGTRGAVTLTSRLIETGQTFAEWIQTSKACWIFSSATLAVGDDFTAFARDLGLEQPQTLKVLGTFDYGNQARLYLPANLPGVDDDGYIDALMQAAEPLLEASNGGAFFLFTSRRALRRAAEIVRERDWPYPLQVQGEGSRARQLEAFRADRNGVLLGTRSFWEGVDVKGDALVLVVIDRLPFATPGDPLLKARIDRCREAGGNPFKDIQIPAAVMALKQGAGRLIRDNNDHGVLMIGDQRLQTRHYRKQFLDSLPPMPIIREERAAVDFLRQWLREPACA
jgi:ATP-dependent DNA helicase DinG